MNKISKYLNASTLIEKVTDLNTKYDPKKKVRTFRDDVIDQIANIPHDRRKEKGVKTSFYYSEKQPVNDVKDILTNMKFNRMYTKRNPIRRTTYITKYHHHKHNLDVNFYTNRDNDNVLIRL